MTRWSAQLRTHISLKTEFASQIKRNRPGQIKENESAPVKLRVNTWILSREERLERGEKEHSCVYILSRVKIVLYGWTHTRTP